MLKAALNRFALCTMFLLCVSASASAQQQHNFSVPHSLQLNVMIKTTLIAYNHANLTGNYTVLRDLGSPGFQLSNTPARLSEIFQKERKRKIDVSPIVLLTPTLSQKPALDAQGRLILRGFFDSQPDRVNFTLGYEVVGGVWKLYAIGVNTAPKPKTPAVVHKQPSKKKNVPKNQKRGNSQTKK